MQQRPAIAVVAPNVLMGVGLKAILEKIIPMADVELFGDFETFAQATPERFFHFFVAAQLFVTHSSYFRPLRHKTILLCNGQPQPAYADMHRIDVCTSEETVVRDILRMHHGAHHHEHDIAGAAHPAIAQLSGREAEVLALIARGYMNKEIAGHSLGGRAGNLRHDGRICRGRRTLSASSQIRIAASEIIPLLCS